MRVGLIAGSATVSGIGRYAAELLRGLNRRSDTAAEILTHSTGVPGSAFARRWLGMDVDRFFQTYPLSPLGGNVDLFHLTYQSLASCLWLRPRRPVVVTAHDIFPLLYRNDPALNHYSHRAHRWMDGWAMRQLRRADAVITDSGAVRDNLVRTLDIPESRVHIIPCGVDQTVFRPREVAPSLLARFGLTPGTPYVLHVSSEDPRKDVPTLLRAWKDVTTRVPNALLLKAGRPYSAAERSRTIRLIDQLGITASVRLLDEVSGAELVDLYNVASVFAFPSIAEGFGFPVLEAMSCGTPVVCSDIAALRELVGTSAVCVPPQDSGVLADALVHVLEDPAMQRHLGQAGIERARMYTWDRTAEMTARVYASILPRR